MIWRALLIVSLLAMSTYASAENRRIIYTYPDDNSIEKKPIAFVSADPPTTDSMCEHRIADVVVDDVSYSESSGLIDGFSASNHADRFPKTYWNLDTIDLDSRQMVDISRIFQAGTKLVVLYEVCGAADFHYAREVWLKSAVNSP